MKDNLKVVSITMMGFITSHLMFDNELLLPVAYLMTENIIQSLTKSKSNG